MAKLEKELRDLTLSANMGYSAGLKEGREQALQDIKDLAYDMQRWRGYKSQKMCIIFRGNSLFFV